MSLYNELTQKSGPIKYKFFENGRSLVMENHYNPVSITITEFDIIKDKIVKYGLKRGYEVATAFGISALAAGLGFKETGGKLMTMDCYVEEHFNSDNQYRGKVYPVFVDADGWKSVNFLIQEYNLQDVVFPFAGYSPTGTELYLSHVFNLQEEKLDYVFIDAAHWDSALLDDINVVLPFMAKECHLFIHDLHAFGSGALNQIENSIGAKISILDSCRMPQGFNLAHAISQK